MVVGSFSQDRKQIMKVLKRHIERMCVDDEAQLVLFTALDVTEYVIFLFVMIVFLPLVYSDTKLLVKSLVSSITVSAQKLYSSSQGRRSLLYLFLPCSRRHFIHAQNASHAETMKLDHRLARRVRRAERRRSERPLVKISFPG